MLGEHGSFRRYVMTAMVNFLAFYSLWEFFVFILPEDNYWPTVSWAIAWFLGSLQAQPWRCTLSEEWVQPLVTTLERLLGDSMRESHF